MSQQNVEDIYPLTPAQQSMLLYLLVAGQPSRVLYFDQHVSTVDDLDPAALRAAWQRVVDRHPALRTLFVWENRDQPLQVVRRQVDLPWQEHDWHDLPLAEREARFAEFLRADHARSFDLRKAPLTRVAVVRWTEKEWRVVWSFSHFVLDGWSMALVLSEVLSLYGAARDGRELALPPARPFREFIGWLRRQDPEQAKAYWQRTLPGFEPPTALPFDGTGGPRDTGWAAVEIEHAVDPRVERNLNELVRRHQITPNTLFQGLWGLLLGRYGATTDVVYGSIVSGRPYELDGVEAMVGMFINILPVRLGVDPATGLIPWLQRLQADQFEQREFEYCSYEQIVVWTGMPRNLPLYESVLVYENYPIDPLRQDGGLALRDVHLAAAGNFPLTLYMEPNPGGMTLKLAYHWNRFSDGAAERLLTGLESLLAAVLERPEARLGDLSLLRPAERAELIAAAAGPRAGLGSLPVHRAFQLQAARTPEAVAVTSALGTLSYGELDRAARRLAVRLRAAGVGPESIVGLCAERSAEMVAGMLAILEAGGAYLPLDPAYPPERLAYMLADSGARVLLAQERLLAKLPVEQAGVVLLDGIAVPGTVEDAPAPVAADVALGRLAYVIYTSGSTGRPKGVLVSHAALAHYVDSAVQGFGIGPADRVLQFASISFDTSGEEIYPCLTQGATLVLRDDEMVASLERFAREAGTLGVTVLDLPTAYWHELVAEMEQGLEMPASLRLVILGGEQAQRDRLDAWQGRVGDRIRLVNTYGPTEATIVTTRRELSGAAAGFAGEVPIGRAIEDARAYVAGPGQELLPRGIEGELLIGGAGLARGYLGRPDLTAERFVPDPYSGEPGARLYRTGDLVRLSPDGDLEFRGRTDHQVKVRGYRIELGEIETALRAVPAVRDAVVAAREARGGGKRLLAWVVPREGCEPTVSELRAALQEVLPEYMVPSVFSLLAELPVTPSGKVDRRAVARMEADEERPDLGIDFAAPRNQIEEMLVEIWSDLLGVERVGIRDDFFQLGGHSLLVAKLASRVRQAFRVELPMVEVFKNPTVADMAREVVRAERAADVPDLPPIRRAPRNRPIPLSFPQERVWFLDQLSASGNIAYNFQVTIWFRGALDVDALHRTLTEIVRRHEVLRTSFPSIEGQPVQIIHPAGPVFMPVVDLREVPAGERQALSERLVAEATQVPFNVAQAPLIRWTLLQLEDDLHELIQVEHHFVHDGWSFAVMLREIKAIYTAFAAGEPSPLPELPVQYADFAAWQRSWMEGEVMEHLLGYWRRKLAGCTTALELPTDRPRPLQPSFAGELRLLRIEPELYEELRTFSRREGFTLYVTMLAGFFALLQRYTSQDDMLVGTSNANRRLREIEGMIGMVVNSLVLRGDLAGDPPCRELLARMREITLETIAHQDMPLERLVQDLRPERQLNRNPLFQVMFNFHDAGVPDLEFAGLKAVFLVRGNRSAKMDLNVIVIPRAEQRVGMAASESDRSALLHWEYNTDLFDASTMERMIGHYLNLLAGLARHPGQRLSELSMLSEAELGQLLRWNDTAEDFGPEAPLHRLIEAQAARTPEAVAVCFDDSRLTYRELDVAAGRVAARLRALGAGAESLVGVAMERSLQLVVALLGVLKAGAAYVPLDPDYPQERLAFMLEDSGVRVLLTQQRLSGSLPPYDGYLVACDEELPVGAAEPGSSAEVAPDGLAYMIYTSGSTGRPKGALNTHRGIRNRLLWMQRQYGLTAADVVLQKTPFSFDVSVWEFFWPLMTGARLVVAPPGAHQDPARLVGLIAGEGVTTLHFVPSMLQLFLEQKDLGRCAGLRRVICSGEALPPDLQRRFFERMPAGIELHNLYGPTEAAVDVTYWPCAAQAARVPIGRPVSNTRIHLLDGALQPVPAGVPGELYIGGVQLARGYRGRAALTAERFVPDPLGGEPGARLYRTGDLARWLPDGTLDYLRRVDFQVKLRGFRIELGEIELALTGHPEVREAVVVARPDVNPGELRLVAYVVPVEGASPDGELRVFLARQLPEYMVPSDFITLEHLPLSPNGKVDRRALPAPERVRTEEEATYVAPRNPVEETLAAIWGEVLGVPTVGVRDDFFALGGHSLSAARVLSRVRDLLEVELPLSATFERRTVEALAGLIGDKAPSPRHRTEPALQAEPLDGELLARAAALSDADLDALLDDMMRAENP